MGVTSWKLRRFPKENSVILMYHRVVPGKEAEKSVQAGMYVAPETLEAHLRFLTKYFTMVTIHELSFSLFSRANRLNDKPLCALTFDDGWYDFFVYAFPILKSHQVPATVFLPTDYIGTQRWFWTDRLASLFQQRGNSRNPRVSHPNIQSSLVSKLLNLKGSPESRIEAAIDLLKRYPNKKIENVIKELASRWDITLNLTGRVFLTWEEARDMAQSHLISFGSHTASHRILTTLQKQEIEYELWKSRDILITKKVVNPAFIPFSYPNGSYNSEIARIVKDAGYSLAVTTEKGCNCNASDLFRLKRVSIHQDMTSTDAMLGCRIMGLF